MLDYKNIEEELDLILSTVDKELDQVNKEKETLRIIEKNILKTNDSDSSNKVLSLKEIKENLMQIESLNEKSKYLKFYEALNQIEKEKQYLTKLDLINKIVRRKHNCLKLINLKNVELKAIKEYQKNNSYDFEDYALFKTFKDIFAKDFNEIEKLLIDIKFPLFDNTIVTKHLEALLTSSKELKTKEFSFFYNYVVLLNRFSVVNIKEKFNLNNNSNKNSDSNSNTNTKTNPNQIYDNLDFNEVISEFLIKKIHFSIVDKSFKELERIIEEKKDLIKASNPETPEPIVINTDIEIESFFVNFFQNLISYIKKSFENLKEFLDFCYQTKSNQDAYLGDTPEYSDALSEKDFNNFVNNFCIYAIERINFYLIRVLAEEKNFIYFISKSNLIAFQFLKGFLESEKNFKKQNSLKNYQLKYSVSDLFITNEKCFEKLQELIIIQRNFSSNYFQANISNVIAENLEKENSGNLFLENTLFEKLKTLIKDNFLFLSAFEKSPEIFAVTYEENYKSFTKEVLNFLRNVYNKQVSFFSASRKINKFNVLYLIDFCIKILCLKNKLIQKVKKINWLEENKNKFYDYSKADTQRGSNLTLIASNSIFLLNNKISKIYDENYIEEKNTNNNLFYEGLQFLNNFIILLTKEFKEKSFSYLIETFEYGKLVSLDEERIDTTCHNCNEDLKNLIYYIDSSNINKEYEYIIYEIILTDVLVHINNELDTSLRKKPKNKVFSHLADKVKNILDLLISKFNKKEDLKKDENLKNLIKRFNMYMNTLKLYALP